MDKFRFLIVGTVSNCDSHLRRDFLRICSAFSARGMVETFLVESDSTDRTVNQLEELKNSIEGFDFFSAGNLKLNMPNRIERIRYCRNRYVDYIRDYSQQKEWDFIVVADLDGMNSAITTLGIDSSLNLLQEYDAIFANQTFGYYDLLALRCKNWVETDVISEVFKAISEMPRKFSRIRIGTRIRIFLFEDRIRRKYIYSKMHRIRKSEKPIPVDSAFGALGIYKTEIFKSANYVVVEQNEVGASEHVALHARCAEMNYLLAINPALINNHFNPYNLNKLFIVRLLRYLKRIFNRKLGNVGNVIT